MNESARASDESAERDRILDEATNLRDRIRAGTTPDAEEVGKISEQLKEVTEFEAARALIEAFGAADAKRLQPGEDLFRELVFCTYMSEELPPRRRCRQAWDLLKKAGVFADSDVPARLLGLAGATAKRQWEAEGDRNALERSLALYQKGSDEPSREGQYCSVNAAYVLDRLANLAETNRSQVGAAEADAGRHRDAARRIRQTLLERLRDEGRRLEKPQDRWYLRISRAEAHLGLGELGSAVEELRIAAKVGGISAWRYGSVVAQLGAVLELNFGEDRKEEAIKAVADGLGLRSEAFSSALGGKAGIALSGGGFRAALFHLGVLEALAAADRLRRVEVLSCVSGGSIVGAIYYLHLRDLLQRECDCRIGPADYALAVGRTRCAVEKLAASDLRARLFANPVRFLRVLLEPGRSRTSALAEMLGLELGKIAPEAAGRDISLLIVEPKICDTCRARIRVKRPKSSFSPRFENWGRAAKVPILVLNATCLNTGHAWQFTATWEGEPPAQTDTQLDALPRLERLRQRELQKAGKAAPKTGLAEAVATSAAVPGLLAPKTLRGLYEGVAVRLVDGGVHDNQGIGGLFDQGCSRIVVSDASGQMSYERSPGRSVVSVPWRANSVLQARVRELQLEDLERKASAGAIGELLLVHLTLGLESPTLRGITSAGVEGAVPAPTDVTSYGVPVAVQQALSRVRTDLDSFSPLEIDALRENGWRLTETALGGTIGGPTSLVRDPASLRALEVAEHRLFKVARLGGRRWARWVAGAGVLCAAGAAIPFALTAVVSAWGAAPAWAAPAAISLGTALAAPPAYGWLKLGIVNRLYRRMSA